MSYDRLRGECGRLNVTVVTPRCKRRVQQRSSSLRPRFTESRSSRLTISHWIEARNCYDLRAERLLTKD